MPEDLKGVGLGKILTFSDNEGVFDINAKRMRFRCWRNKDPFVGNLSTMYIARTGCTKQRFGRFMLRKRVSDVRASVPENTTSVMCSAYTYGSLTWKQ